MLDAIAIQWIARLRDRDLLWIAADRPETDYLHLAAEGNPDGNEGTPTVCAVLVAKCTRTQKRFFVR